MLALVGARVCVSGTAAAAIQASMLGARAAGFLKTFAQLGSCAVAANF